MEKIMELLKNFDLAGALKFLFGAFVANVVWEIIC